jgi:molecular chaperone GrpE
MEDEVKNEEVQSEPQPEPQPQQDGVAAERDEYLAKWKRTQADYDNLKKQAAREKDEFAAYATFRSAEAFLPAVDHFAEAMRHDPTDANWKQWVMGVKFIRDEFDRAMQELGVTKLEVVGKKFDPTRHVSVGAKHDETKEVGTVLEEKQAGYEMNGKIVRPARVIINE